MTEIDQRIARLSPEKRALLEKRLGGAIGAPAAASGRDAIAIVGAACRFPGEANDLDAFWKLLRGGIDGVVRVPAERWDAEALFDEDATAAGKISSRWGGFISNVDRFDADFFGISPREAIEMDPQQRILLEVAFEALDHAGMTRDAVTGGKMGVFVGVHGHASDYLLLQNENLEELNSFSGTGAAHNLLAGRLSYTLDTHGPAVVVDTACSSSLVAVHLAMQSLRLGESTSVLVGGVNLILTPNFTIAASRMHMLAPDGRCKAFDVRADGFVRSEGCGAVVLKKLSDAVADGDSVLAVIRGSAINQDGHTNGITAPNGLAQRQVIESALADASVAGHSIGFVEAHGTGTALGDPIELEALGATIGKPHVSAEPCYVGSVKTNLGHLEGAAGIAGLIKAALVLHHGEIPPNLHFTGLNPHIRVGGTRFKFPTVVEKWQSTGPRRAGLSSFGWSGTNAHMILEEAPAQARNADAEPSADLHVLTMSGRSAESLAATARLFHERLGSVSSADLDDFCFTAAARRTHYDFRLAAVGRSAAALRTEIKAVLEGDVASRKPAAAPRVAFVFPGHGAQWVGMGRALLDSEPVFRDAMMRCDDAIRLETGWSLLGQIRAPDESSRFDEVEVAQPVLFAFGVALAELWKSWGVLPDAVLGHSMGEVAAAYVAGAVSLADAARIICRRSRLLQQVAGRGGMMLVELSADDAQQAIAGFDGQLVVGAMNGPRSSVLAGDHHALEKVAATLGARDVYCRIVKGSPAGHSHLVEPLKQTLLGELASIKPVATDVAIYSTVTARLEGGGVFDARYWVRNFREPVRFLDAVRALLRDEFDVLVEMSPHPILSSVVRDIVQAEAEADPKLALAREAVALPSLRRDEDDHEVLYASLARLYERGLSVPWKLVLPKARVARLPCYPWQRQRYWLTRTPKHDDQARHADADRVSSRSQHQARIKVSDWLYNASWLEAQLPAARETGKRWILVANKASPSMAFAMALDEKLKSRGGDSQVIFTEDNFTAALDRARLDGGLWSGVIHCAALDATPTSAITAASLAAEPLPGAASLLEVVRSLDSRVWPGDPKLWIVTRGATVVQDADREMLSVAQAPVRSLARVVEAEHPTRYASCVDIDASATPDEQVTRFEVELACGGDEPAVALRGGKRFVQRLTSFRDAGAGRPIKFRADSCYLISGGLGGIGLFVARWMIAQGARHLMILGRTTLPARADWRALEASPQSSAGTRVAAIRELEALGAAIHYFPIDVSDAVALPAVLEQWRADARPPIRGVIHTAAVIDDQLLTELDLHSIEKVFGAKAVGAWLLDNAIPEADWLVLFSSLASIWPAPGHANYAAANAFLDALSQYRSGKGKHALSVSWGLWTDVGFASTPGGREAQRRFAEHGVHGFSPSDGLLALEALLASGVPHAAVLNADREQFAKGYGGLEPWPLLRGLTGRSGAGISRPNDSSGAEVPFITQYRRAEIAQRASMLQKRIGQHVATVLRLDVPLDTQRPLGEYGLNSIMGLELRHRLERDLALRLSATLIWNHPTLAALAAHLQTRLDEQPAAAAGASAPRGREDIASSVPTAIAFTAKGIAASRLSQVEDISDDAALEALRAFPGRKARDER
jgi:acyl transferase domain-containing protein/NAD(P)-dependent dehydrogenase (short-subunit alcohol dehydrogenase family)